MQREGGGSWFSLLSLRATGKILLFFSPLLFLQATEKMLVSVLSLQTMEKVLIFSEKSSGDGKMLVVHPVFWRRRKC